MKVCRKCKEEKPLTEFYALKKAADGKQSYCKECSKECGRAWELSNIDKVRAKQAAWHAANPEKVKAWWDAWRAANPEKVKASKAKYLQQVRERRRAARAAWFEANKDAITKPIKTPEEW